MGGVIADVFSDSKVRGRVMSLWSVTTLIGPLSAPMIAGYLAPYGWRYAMW